MFVFSSGEFLKGVVEVAIARHENGLYSLVLPKTSGFVHSRQMAHLNYSTPPTLASVLHAPNGRPCFWFDSDWDRKPSPLSDLLPALTSAHPRPPLRPTGRKQKMTAEGVERVALEVELLLDEEELVSVCYYCGELESVWDIRDAPYRRIGGQGYASTYSCVLVSVLVSCPYDRYRNDLRSYSAPRCHS